MCPTPDERPHVSDTASLITLRSILDIEIARSYQWDAATIIAVSGVDRAGDLTTRIVEHPGALADIAAEGFSPHSAAGHALSHELHDAIQRRVRLWIAEIPTQDRPSPTRGPRRRPHPRGRPAARRLHPRRPVPPRATRAMGGRQRRATRVHARRHGRTRHASRPLRMPPTRRGPSALPSSNAPRSCGCAATPSSSPTSSSSCTRWREPCPSCTSPSSGATGASCGPST